MLSLWIVFLSIVTLCVATSFRDCPDNLPRDKYLQTYNGYCFQFHTSYLQLRGYEAASAICNTYGGTLALVKTPEMQDFLYNHLYYTYGIRARAYIGLSDRRDEGKFMWEDGTPLGEWKNWAPDSGPNGKFMDLKWSFVRDCVTMDTTENGQWVDEICESGLLIRRKMPFICQFQTSNEKTTPKLTSLKPSRKTTVNKPLTVKSTAFKTPALKLTTLKRISLKSTTLKLLTLNPINQKPTTPKPAIPQPTTSKPTTSEPTTSKSTTSKPTTSKHTTSKPITSKPTTPKPTTAESTVPSTSNPGPFSPTLETSTMATARPTCPPFVCELNCQMEGYKADQVTGCAVCECDD